MKEELLRLENICCSGILHNLRLNIFEGEVLVLTGLMDSGLFSVGDFLGGTLEASSGFAWFAETPVPLNWFGSTNKNSIFRFRKECSLVKNMTVAENIFVIHHLMAETSIVKQDALLTQTASILKNLNLNIRPDDLVDDLKLEDQRIVELIKAVALGARLIVLEDAWGSYPQWARDSVFGMIGAMRSRGVSFLIITQRHEDTRKLMDRMVLMSGGRNIMTLDRSEYQTDFVYRLLIGKDFYLPSEPFGHGVMTPARPFEMLHVENLSGKYLRSLSFSASSGKIFGILDIQELGSREFVNALFFGRSYEGRITLAGNTLRSTDRLGAMRLGVGLLAYRDGSFLQDNLTWPENLAIIYHQRVPGSQLLSKRVLRMLTAEYEGEMDGLDPTKPLCEAGISEYSRLKLTYLKWILLRPKLLVCVKPCSFGDVLMREIAISMLHQAAAQGICVLVVSCDPKEAGVCCDRIGILQDGALSCTLERDEFLGTETLPL